MGRIIGFFTSYGIEYVYDYLGSERIHRKIAEIKTKSTGSMGISLEEFTYGNPGYYSQKGILYVFTMLLDWFKEVDLILFLYENSKKYNEANYHDSGYLSSNWKGHLEQIEWMKEGKRITNDQYINYISSPYWIDFHFFVLSLLTLLLKVNKEKISLQSNLVGSYKLEKNKLTGKYTLEIKTRRKPLLGQYLSFKDISDWYNLEKINYNEIVDNYQFKKDDNLYRLISYKAENKADIELIASDKATKIHNENILMFEQDKVIEGLIKNYAFNITEISLRFKLEKTVFSNGQPMLNACLDRISEYYYSKKKFDEMNEIIELNNHFNDVWKALGNYEEE